MDKKELYFSIIVICNLILLIWDIMDSISLRRLKKKKKIRKMTV